MHALVHFERGTMLEQAGRIDEAFAAFAEGNRLRRLEFDPEAALVAAEARLELARSLYEAAFMSGQAGHPSAAPLFVVGMPRSGSTLVEQILIAHRQVRGMGECNALKTATEGLFPFDLRGLRLPRHFRSLGDRYLTELRRLGWAGSKRVVDKTLTNRDVLGAVRLMFPKATIVHCVRDPLDTCLSIFRRSFARYNDTAYDLRDIARHYVQYRRMMSFWADRIDMVEVSNEALVADPEGQIRRLLSACGLDWDPACLDFHIAPRAATSGSVEEVRRPMSAASIGRWRAYRNHLGPLIEALGPYAAESLAADTAAPA